MKRILLNNCEVVPKKNFVFIFHIQKIFFICKLFCGGSVCLTLLLYIFWQKMKKKRLIAFLDMATMRIFKKKKNQKHHGRETDIPSDLSKCREGFKKKHLKS